MQAGGQEFESLHLHSSKDESLAVMPAHLTKCVVMTVKQSKKKRLRLIEMLHGADQDEFATVHETGSRMYLENRIQNLISESKG